MAKTLLQVQKEIQELRAIEEKLKRAEAQGVIERIREAISVYGFSPEDLFGPAPGRVATKSSGAAAAPAGKAKSSGTGTAHFSDGTGNVWSGMGPKPAWVLAALNGGKTLGALAVTRIGKRKAKAFEARSASGTGAAAPRGKVKIAIKYRDGSNAWSGRGSQPNWLKAAIASGKSIEQFKV